MLYRRKRRLRRQLFRFLFILFLFTGLSTFFLHKYVLHPVSKKVLDAAVTPTTEISPTHSIEGLKIDQVVEGALEGTKGKYSVVVKNLSNNQSYSRDQDRVFESASLYKLWIMAVVFEKIEDGSLNKTDMLKEDVGTLNKKFNISSESAELTEGVVSYSVQDALYQMITISDNYAALLLTEKIRLSTVAQFIKDEHLTHSSVGGADSNPTTSASDVAQILEKIYKGELVSKDASDEMLALLKEQKLNNKLPKYIPEDIFIAHKTGELDAFTHDAGIVYASTPYLIVVLSESTDPLSAEERISQVSGDVYKFFTQ